MHPMFWIRTRSLALVLGAIATTSLLNACATPSQNQAQAPSPSTTAGMDHGNAHDNAHQGSMMNHSASMELGPADADFDLRFVDAMTPHHEGAVTMAQEALSKSKRPEIQKLAQDIIKSQATEIQQMQQWRQAWYQR